MCAYAGDLSLSKFRVVDESGSVDITFFNQPYIKNNIHRGDCLNIYGKIIGVGGKRTMTNPVIEREGTVGGVTGRIVPVYRLTTGLSQKLIMSAVRQALDASACRAAGGAAREPSEKIQACSDGICV